MELKQILLSDLKGAMKSRDSLKVDTLRLIVSDIKYKEIDLHEERWETVISPLS